MLKALTEVLDIGKQFGSLAHQGMDAYLKFFKLTRYVSDIRKLEAARIAVVRLEEDLRRPLHFQGYIQHIVRQIRESKEYGASVSEIYADHHSEYVRAIAEARKLEVRLRRRVRIIWLPPNRLPLRSAAQFARLFEAKILLLKCLADSEFEEFFDNLENISEALGHIRKFAFRLDQELQKIIFELEAKREKKLEQ